MTIASKKVALVSSDITDHHVWRQAFEPHPDRLELICLETHPDNPDEFGYIISPTQSTLRIGRILDDVESKILNAARTPILTYKNYTLDWKQSTLRIEGKAIDLTEREREIIYILLSREGQGTSRERLLDHVWEYRSDLETHTLETHIYRLRQKIERDPTNHTRLLTIENGYALV